MKEANPRIFRSLEKAHGVAEFDTIVAAAVASYGAVRQPSEARAREFANLVLPVWDRLKPETRRSLGASLSHSANVPRSIVEKLLAEPIEISAPFLLSSPVLTEADRRHLAESRDGRLRRLAGESASAKAPATPTPEPLAPPRRADVVADELPADVEPDEPAAVPEAAPEPARAVSAVRDALRRMAQPRRRRPAGFTTPAELVELAVQGDVEATLQAIGAMAGIDEATLALVSEDESGERLAVALKAMALRDTDAMTIMMMLKPKVGLDVTAFDLMTRYYRALKSEDCAALLGVRRRIAAPALEPIFDDIERMDRTAARAAFGRRARRPASPEAKSREA